MVTFSLCLASLMTQRKREKGKKISFSFISHQFRETKISFDFLSFLLFLILFLAFSFIFIETKIEENQISFPFLSFFFLSLFIKTNRGLNYTEGKFVRSCLFLLKDWSMGKDFLNIFNFYFL